MKPCDTVIEKPIHGASQEGCVLKKVNGAWQLWKMAGGGRFYAPDPNDAPYIADAYIKSSRKDSPVRHGAPAAGHAPLRYPAVLLGGHGGPSTTTYAPLLTYSPGDWLMVLTPTTNLGDAFDYVYFNGRRYELSDTVKLDSVSPGIYRLSLEHIPATVLWEEKGDYNATVWGIPIRVQ